MVAVAVAAGREDQTSERAAHILTPPSEAQIPDLLRAAGRLRLGITSITRCLTTSCHSGTAGDVFQACARVPPGLPPVNRSAAAAAKKQTSRQHLASWNSPSLPSIMSPALPHSAVQSGLEKA